VPRVDFRITERRSIRLGVRGFFWTDRAGREIMVGDCSLINRQEEGRWPIVGCFAVWSM
jgi:hypothetical protein